MLRPIRTPQTHTTVVTAHHLLYNGAMQYQAVMFDLDGTLLNTLPAIADAANSALTALGQPTHLTEDYRSFVGHGARRLIGQALSDEQQVLTERGLELFRAHYKQHGKGKTRRYPGIALLLDALTTRGLVMAVLSNKPDDATQAAVTAFFDSSLFAAIQGHRPTAPLKPDPTSALAITRQLGIEPERWIYVGDMAVDMQTGIAARMFPVGVGWGFRDEAELVDAGAGAIVHQPLQLLDLVQNQANNARP